MFSWSINWLWAQCLVVGAGFFLLSHLADPGPGNLTVVRGTVEEIGSTSRKGLGSFYELRLKTDDGQMERVLVARRDVAANAMQKLVGRHIRARVNWSSEAIDLTTTRDASSVLSEENSSATARRRDYNLVGGIATLLGLVIGALTLTLSPTARRLAGRVFSRPR